MTLENLSTFQVGSGVRTFHQRQGKMLEGFKLAVSEARLYFGKFPKVVGGEQCGGVRKTPVAAVTPKRQQAVVVVVR